MTLYPELDNLTLEELIQKWLDSPIDGEEYANIYYEEVAYRLKAKGDAGVQFLLRFLLDHKDLTSDVSRVRAAMEALPPIANPAFEQLLLKCVQQQWAGIVDKAINALQFQDKKDAVNLVLALKDHKDPQVRGSVLSFMNKLFPEEAKPLLIQALQDQHFVVRENAIDELDASVAVETLERIQPLVNDPHPDIRVAAQTAVSNLLAAQQGN